MRRIRMGKKVNPRKVQATEEDVKRALNRGLDIGVKRALKLTLYLLLDKHQAPVEDVRTLAEEIAWLAARVNEGRISWKFIDKVLDENGVQVRMR